MKRLTLLLVLSFSLIGRSQSDTLFPNVAATWDIGTWQLQTNGSPPLYAGYIVHYSPDSIPYNGYEWDILEGGIWGLIRQDSGKIIVQFPWGGVLGYGPFHSWTPDTNEIVLYDFNLEAGDTAYFEDSWIWNPVTVDSVGYTNVLGQWRKTIYLEDNERWISGMGSDQGFFYPVCTHFELGISHVCFQGEYMDSLGSFYNIEYEDNLGACSIGFESIVVSEINFKCFQHRIEVSLTSPNQLRIFAYDGRVVHSQSLPQGESVLDVSFLERGAYIVQIGDSFTEKFIKN